LPEGSRTGSLFKMSSVRLSAKNEKKYIYIWFSLIHTFVFHGNLSKVEKIKIKRKGGGSVT
jgi:hypothetical protein